MTKHLKQRRGALILSLLFVAACNRDMNTAQGVAEEFVDQHYVGMNLQKAKALAVSIAQNKIDEEIRLTAGHKIDASTQIPRVNYTLLEKKESGQRTSFLFEGTVRSEDNSTFTRKWLITIRKEGNQWRVSNFTESD